MMDPSFRIWGMKINRADKNFGKKLKKEESVQGWSNNKMIFNIGNSSLMNSMISLILQIRDMMQRETIPKEQM
jgi:ABC-type uncharacterized transport system permease subunit